jgi:hypothetical protein
MEEDGRISKKDAGEVRVLLKSDDPETIVKIADLSTEIPQKIGKPAKLGFLLLQKNIWKGTLDLENEETVKALKKYIA